MRLKRIERARAAMKTATTRAAMVNAMNQLHQAEKAYAYFTSAR